jgi:hypothetical protein
MKAVGWACDVCKQFHTSEDERTPPVGWMIVTTIVDSKLVANASVNQSFHICSNKCLRDLGATRWKAEREGGEAYEPMEAPTSVSNGAASSEPSSSASSSVGKKEREYSPETREKMRRNGLRLQHTKGVHSDDPNAECELCIAEYEGR